MSKKAEAPAASVVAPVARRPRAPRVRVKITNEIIAASCERDSSHCMIADGLGMAVPESKLRSVDLQTIRYTDKKRRLRYTYLTPRIAQVNLVKFDQGLPIEPFEFMLRSGQVTAIKERNEDYKKRHTQRNRLRRAQLVNRESGKTVMERVGGKTPPLQRTADDIPFSRRRAFGLRALDL